MVVTSFAKNCVLPHQFIASSKAYGNPTPQNTNYGQCVYMTIVHSDDYYMLLYSSQVLCNSISCAFKLMKKDEFQETSKFCYMFDRFFDCLNTCQ